MSDSEDGRSEAELAPLEPLQKALHDSIDQIQGTGTIASGGVIDECPIPSISVRGHRPISLPLMGEDAQVLENLFGVREAATDITISIIDAENIKFHNPKWHGFINRVSKYASWKMGVPAGSNGDPDIRAELSKSVLYGPGASQTQARSVSIWHLARFRTTNDPKTRRRDRGHVWYACHLPSFATYRRYRTLLARKKQYRFLLGRYFRIPLLLHGLAYRRSLPGELLSGQDFMTATRTANRYKDG